MTDLRAANPSRGWVAIPDECPPQIAARIVEKRAQQIGGTTQQQDPATETLRDQLRAASLL